MVKAELEIGQTYWVKWRCRDIGYGIEHGSDEYVYTGQGLDGKRSFESPETFATNGVGDAIYLFDDEIVYCEAD